MGFPRFPASAIPVALAKRAAAAVSDVVGAHFENRTLSCELRLKLWNLKGDDLAAA